MSWVVEKGKIDSMSGW